MNDQVNDPRKTQFQGFAKALVTEIINEVPATIYPLDIDISDKLEKLLARRAYDLACHVAEYVGPIKWDDQIEWDDQYIAKLMSYVPRLTELPKEQG